MKNPNYDLIKLNDCSTDFLIQELEWWSNKFDYKFSFQFWGENDNNWFIMKGDLVDLASGGGENSPKAVIIEALKWCWKMNKKHLKKQIQR